MAATQKDTSLEDIGAAIQQLGTNMQQGFDRLEGRMDGLEQQQIQTNQHLVQIDRRLDHMDGRLEAVESDVKELYAMFADLQKYLQKIERLDVKTRRRVDAIEAFVLAVSKQTGIPYRG